MIDRMALQSAHQCDAPVTRMRSMRCYEAMYTPCAWSMTTRGIYGFSSFKSASGRFTNKCCKIRYPTKPSAWRDVLVRENNQSAGTSSDVERDGTSWPTRGASTTPPKRSTASFVSARMSSTPQMWIIVVLLCDCRTVNEITKAATSRKEEIWKRFHELLLTIP